MESAMPLFDILGMGHSKYDGLLSASHRVTPQSSWQTCPLSNSSCWGRSDTRPSWVYIPPQRHQQIRPPNRIPLAPIPPMIEEGGVEGTHLPLLPHPAMTPASRPRKEYFQDKKSCGHCHSRDTFHWKTGCPVLTELNLVCVEDATKAKVILTKYTTHIESLGGARGQIRLCPTSSEPCIINYTGPSYSSAQHH